MGELHDGSAMCVTDAFQRHFTGEHRSGVREKSKKLIVCVFFSLKNCTHSTRLCSDIANKLHLIAPIAEQCKHQSVLLDFMNNSLEY